MRNDFMKAPLIIILFTICVINTVFGQQGNFVAKDYRIDKFEKDIIVYLIKNKQVLNVKTPFKVEDYKLQIVVSKQLEFFSDTFDKNLLLIKFSTSADHGDIFWGLLSNEEKCFFSDTKDPVFLKFKKEHDLIQLKIIAFFCNQNKRQIQGF